MEKGKFIAYFVAVLFMMLPGQLMAAAQGGNIHFGNLYVSPGITLQEVRDDNIYLGNGTNDTTEAKKSDWITYITPGILLGYDFPERGYAKLGYSLELARYNEYDKNNWKNHNVNLDVNYAAPAGLILGIKDDYKKAEDPYGSADQYALGRVAKRWQNDLKTKVGYGITSDLRALAYYNYYRQDYKDDADYTQDYRDHEVGMGGEVRFMPKTWGFLRYHYGVRDYYTYLGTTTSANDADYKWHRVNTGLTWDADSKITGELNVGYQWKKYDNATIAGTTRTRSDKNTWIAATNLNYQPSETTLLTANISRALRETGADTDESFTDTAVGVDVQQMFLTKFVGKAGTMYSENDYNNYCDPISGVPADRKDKNLLFNLGLDYNIQEWLTVGAGYSYKRKDSNQDAYDFKDNQFMAMVKVVY